VKESQSRQVVLRFTVVDHSDFSPNRLTVSLDSSYPSLGSGSLEQDGPLGIVAMEKEKQTGGRSMTSHIEKDNVMRTKRASGFRRVLFQRSTWAVSPVSLPSAVCCSEGDDRSRDSQKVASCNGPGDTLAEWPPTTAGTSVCSDPQRHTPPPGASCGRGQSKSRRCWLF
jgi:hypothetical protein